MEMIKDVIIDFVLFSGIEGFIFCLFFEKIGKCRKFKLHEWLILSVGISIISQILPPTIRQFIMIIFISLLLKYLRKFNEIFVCFKMSLCGLSLFLLTEVPYNILLELIINKDLSTLSILELFIYLIPIKLLEIFICLEGRNIMKVLFGGVVRK